MTTFIPVDGEYRSHPAIAGNGERGRCNDVAPPDTPVQLKRDRSDIHLVRPLRPTARSTHITSFDWQFLKS